MGSSLSVTLGFLLLVFFACVSDAKVCDTPKGWHLDRLDQEKGLDSCYTPNVKPKVKPVLYVIDSGVYGEHSEFSQNRVSHGYNFHDRSWDSSDCSGHGSHVAALAAGKNFGVAGSIPVDIVSVRILDCEGRGSCSGMVKAMDWVYNNHTTLRKGVPGVAVMSVGSRQNECLAADIAAEALSSANILVVAAAGNSNIDACMVHPASSENTVTVGAVGLDDATSKDIVWAKSNHGKCVTVHAPGQGITSAGLSSPKSEKVMSGTSMAAPMIAGQSLLIMAAAPHLPVSAVREIIATSATRGTLESSEDLESDVKIAHVPWKQMHSQGQVRSASENEFEGATGGDSTEVELVQFDLQTSTMTDPPMQYIGDSLARNITTRLALALVDNEPLSVTCSLSPESAIALSASGVDSSPRTEEGKELMESPEMRDEVAKTVRNGNAGDIPLRLRCEVRCTNGRGKDVKSTVEHGIGKVDAKSAEVWTFKTPEGAPASATGDVILLKASGGASGDGSGAGEESKMSTTSWVMVAVGATAGVACVAGVGFIARKHTASSGHDILGR